MTAATENMAGILDARMPQASGNTVQLIRWAEGQPLVIRECWDDDELAADPRDSDGITLADSDAAVLAQALLVGAGVIGPATEPGTSTATGHCARFGEHPQDRAVIDAVRVPCYRPDIDEFATLLAEAVIAPGGNGIDIAGCRLDATETRRLADVLRYLASTLPRGAA